SIPAARRPFGSRIRLCTVPKRFPRSIWITGRPIKLSLCMDSPLCEQVSVAVNRRSSPHVYARKGRNCTELVRTGPRSTCRVSPRPLGQPAGHGFNEEEVGRFVQSRRSHTLRTETIRGGAGIFSANVDAYDPASAGDLVDEGDQFL